MNNTVTKQNKLIYIFDALCPWCYAFTPVVKNVYDNYCNHFEFEVLSGGLAVGEQVKTLGGHEDSEKLRKGYQKIEEKTGIQFGEKFFERVAKETIILNSEVPATALAVFRDSNSPFPDIEFIHQLLHTFFFEGQNPNDKRVYKNLATHFQLDPQVFVNKMEEKYFQQQARYDFVLAKQLQAEAFPRLYLQTSPTYFHLIAKGYSDYEDIDKIINKITAVQ